MNRSTDGVDHLDPRTMMEESELLDGFQALAARETVLANKLLFWILDAKNLAAIATRAYIAAYVASPDVVEGITLNQIARLSGHGRSAAHNLVKEFEDKFEVRSRHARSDEARANYSKAYHARNGSYPHSYNPIKTK